MTAYPAQKPGEGYLPGLLIFLSSFSALLFFSTAPLNYPGDTSLFISASYFLGTAHPPSYPLYVLLGKIFTFIPLGNLAFRVNLLSAVSGGLAMALAYQSAYLFTRSRAASVLASLVAFVSPCFVLESSKAEVYGVNAALVMLIFYLCARALDEDKPFRLLLLACFVQGIAMSNHHTSGFMIFPIAYTILARREVLPLRIVLIGPLMVFVGLLVYLYMIARSMAGSYILYSAAFDFEQLLYVFFRKGYAASSLSSISGTKDMGMGWIYAARNFWRLLAPEMPPIVWGLALTGIAFMWSNRRRFGLLVVSFAAWLILSKMIVSMKELEPLQLSIANSYYLQVIPMIGCLAAFGVYSICSLIKNRSRLVGGVLLYGILLVYVPYAGKAFQKSSLSNDYIAYNLIRDISNTLKPKSFFLTFGDNPPFLTFYGFGVERMRDDVLCLEGYSGSESYRLFISPAWKFSIWYPEFYKEKMTKAAYFRDIAAQYRLYSSNSTPPSHFTDKFDLKPYLLVSILVPKSGAANLDEMIRSNFEKIDYLPIVPVLRQDYMQNEIFRNYVRAIWSYSKVAGKSDFKRADYYYRLAIFLTPPPAVFEIVNEYADFILEQKGTAAYRDFIDELKATELSSYSDRIKALEAKIIGVYSDESKVGE